MKKGKNMLKIYLSPEIEQIKDKEFMTELQFQLNSFLSGNNDVDTHYYISQYKPTAIAMYFPDPNTVYAETIPLEIEKDDRYWLLVVFLFYY